MIEYLIKNISLVKFFQQYLANAVLEWETKQHQNILPKKNLNLLRIRQENKIFYHSAITFPLSNYYHLDPVIIAQELSIILNQEHKLFNLKITNTGKLEFYPQDLLLGNYLQNLTNHHYFTIYSPDLSNINTEAIIPFQYLSDRCSQLLNLGHETKLIQLLDPTQKKTFYQWQKPDFFPFLIGDKLKFNHSAEIELIEKLIMIIDLPDQLKKINYIKVGRSLGESFLNFHQQCQIWGETAKNDVKLSQGRLSLIALTQFVLQWLLTVNT